jgi:hypothetical protein
VTLRAKRGHPDKIPPQFARRISINENPRGIARIFFVLDQALVILNARSLIIAAQTSLESDWQCDSLGPA